MAAISYTVIATLPDQATADEFTQWLANGHVDQVKANGAQSAQIVRLIDPPSPIQVEVRYTFADRQAFDRYVADAAPRLRAEGMSRFPPERSVRFERRLGVFV